MEHERPASVASYALVFLALLALTALTVGVAFLDLGFFSTPVALGIATVKALLILAFFMHLRHQNKLLWCFALTGFFWLAVLTVGALDDVLTRPVEQHPELSEAAR
jgi:cytochrome c oxidase subunit IV